MQNGRPARSKHLKRNSGDEEIRRLIRSLNKNPNAMTAEMLAKELRRREESDPRPVFACPNCGEERPEPEGSCVLESLAEVVVSRLATVGGNEGQQVMEWLSGQDAGDLWDRIAAPAADVMEEEFREDTGFEDDEDSS